MNLLQSIQHSQNLTIFVNQLNASGYALSKSSSDESELVYAKFEFTDDANTLYLIFFNASDNFISVKAKHYSLVCTKNVGSRVELLHSASAIFAIDEIVNDDVAIGYLELVNHIIK